MTKHAEQNPGQNAAKSKGEKKRAILLALARKQLIEKGYDALIMRELAASADMRLGNLQYYFKTKNDLVAEIFLKEAETDIAVVGQSIPAETLDAASASAQLSELLIFILNKWHSEDGRVFRAMAYLKQYHPVFEPIYNDIYSAFFDAQLVPLKIIQPGLTKSAYKAKARMICALVDGSTAMVLGRDKKRHFQRVAALALYIAEQSET